MEIRNIAIIAHVDHGKTSLTDALMRQTGVGAEGVSMDSNALEQERGITIYSKNTSIFYKDTKINIVDTPGHADFGSEVERVLRAIDSVLLVVDAAEGPMPQTKFVLKKSLELGLKPILLINKMDKPTARPEWVYDQVFDLFHDLGATDEQLDFTCLYTISRDGIAKLDVDDPSRDLTPLLEVILQDVPAASSEELNQKPLLIQPFNLGYDNFLGRLAIGRIYQGVVKSASNVVIKKPTGEISGGKITKMFNFKGLKREEISGAVAGDIVMIAGLPDIYIGDTICIDQDQDALPAIKVDEPTISLDFLVNDSPFAGRDGKFVTIRQIKERLERELEMNVGLKVDFSPVSHYKVYGRGELHIAILLENMRREGYELQVSQPQVIIKEENGVKLEPFEEIIIDIPNSTEGVVIEKLARRKGMMTSMLPEQNHTRLTFEIPTRGLLGYRGEFVVDTKGEGIICSHFMGFKPWAGEIQKQDVGSMVSMVTGKALGFSLWNLQERGRMFIGPATEVYEGMVIGNTAKGNDMSVNPTKGKQLSNMRSSGADDAITLVPPLTLTLERGLEVMKDDECMEITPKNIRLRKFILTKNDRAKEKRAQEEE